ncbi:MAG: hypothetical protein Q9181_005730 [Wetmoreana brouardii]
MVHDLSHPAWQSKDLEDQVRRQLMDSYDACISSLWLINQTLAEILKETGGFEILAQKKHGTPDTGWKDWLRRLRQRSKVSFSKDRLDDKLEELQDRIDGLRKLRKQVERIEENRDMYPSTRAITDLSIGRVIQRASSDLHDVLSCLWQCETSSQHFAGIALDVEHARLSAFDSSRKVQFKLAWSCLTPSLPTGLPSRHLWLSVDTVVDEKTVTEETPSGLPPRVESMLMIAAKRNKYPDEYSEIDRADTSALPDLQQIPNLCLHLGQNPSPVSVTDAGFLQKSETPKYIIRREGITINQTDDMKSLEDALIAAKSGPEGISYPEKTELANQQMITQDTADSVLSPPLHSPIRNQTLFRLAVILIELAYNCPLQDLTKPEDNTKDPHTLYWSATRLAEGLGRKLGPLYAGAAKICLYGGFGASTDLNDTKVQTQFFYEVVQKLARCAEAVQI